MAQADPCPPSPLLVLAHLRCEDTYARLACGFGVGLATVYRYIRETVDLLASMACDVTAAVRAATAKAYRQPAAHRPGVGAATKADRPYYSGKHKRHGVYAQVLADPAGRLIWASPALPGAVHDLKATRTHGPVDALTDAGVMTRADRGDRGAKGTVGVPFRGRRLPTGPAAVNVAHARLRAPSERAVATVKK